MNIRTKLKSITALSLVAALVFPSTSFAYGCGGAITYLGLDGSGNVFVAVGSTALHGICSIQNQGNYAMPPAVCKAAYASLVAARIAGKNMTIYYGDNGYSCTTLPAWGTVPSTYFVEGPQ